MATKKKPARKQKLGTAKRAPAKLDGYYSGPMEWLSPMLEEAYMKLRPKEDAEAEAAAMAKPRRPRPVAKTAARKPVFRSVHHEGQGESARPVRDGPWPDRQSCRNQRPRVRHRHSSWRRADLRCVSQRRRVAVRQ